jgi:hypothetical protein
MVTTARSAAEAAAVVAAVEQFLADTAPVAAPQPGRSGWQTAALREGVGARQLFVGEDLPWQS